MSTYVWIADRDPEEFDFDIYGHVHIQDLPGDGAVRVHESNYKPGTPWRHTQRKRRKRKVEDTHPQHVLFTSADQWCSTCRFFDSPMAARQGICRRYAPKPTTGDKEHSSAFWPEVVCSSWCGEWEAKA
jgi:hypothetical protein